MSIDHPTADSLLAAYVLDAVEDDEALEIEDHLSGCPACTSAVAELQGALEPLAAATSTAPPPDLRVRTLEAALAQRPPRHQRFAPADVHLIESTRLLALLQSLSPDQWSAPVGPSFPDWSVHDLAAHLAASEALLADVLGTEPFTPETDDQPEPRAHAAVARHRRLPPDQTLAELRTAYEHVHAAVRALGADADSCIVAWFGLELSLGFALTQRAFEIWTHADDIRAALGLDQVPPPPGSVETMSSAAIETVPLMLAATGVDAEGRRARISLTGPGGATYDVALGLVDASPAGRPDVVVELDVVEFCRAIGDRRTPDELDYRASGDAALAVDLVRSLPALAVL